MVTQNYLDGNANRPSSAAPHRQVSPKLLPIILGIVMIGETMSKIEVGAAAALGYVFLGLLLFGAVFWFFIRNSKYALPSALYPLMRTQTLLFSIYTAALLYHFDGEGIIMVAQLLAISLFFIGMCSVNWTSHFLQQFACVISIIVPIYAGIWIATGHQIATLAGVIHSNIVGVYTFSVIMVQVFAAVSARSKSMRSFFILCIVVGLAVVVVTETRSLWIATFFSLLTFGLWNFLSARRRLFSLYFLVMVGIVLGFTYVYPHLKHFSGADATNDAVSQTSGKSLFSGRDRLWAVLTSVTLRAPWTGYGAGAIAQTFIAQSNDSVAGDSDLSAHNLYIQIALQIGFIGLAVYLAILWQVWHVFWIGRYNLYARISACYLIGLLFYETFEITLTQNKLAVGTFQWLILAIGVSKCLEVYQARSQAIPPGQSENLSRAHFPEMGTTRV